MRKKWKRKKKTWFQSCGIEGNRFRNFMLINKRNIVGNYEASRGAGERRRCQPLKINDTYDRRNFFSGSEHEATSIRRWKNRNCKKGKKTRQFEEFFIMSILSLWQITIIIIGFRIDRSFLLSTWKSSKWFFFFRSFHLMRLKVLSA